MAKKQKERTEPHICYLCNVPIEPDEKYEFIQTRRGSKLYIHVECMRKECGRKYDTSD